MEEKSPKGKVFYWQGILDPKDLSEDYQKIIQKIAAGDYTGLHLEKLIGHDVFSVRINGADRLLFTTIKVEGKPYLLLLDVVLNHDYGKSRFLKPAVLKNYLELHGQLIEGLITDAHFKPQTTTPSFASQIKETSFGYYRVEFHKQKFFELHDEQVEAGQKQLPLIISGVPGAGILYCLGNDQSIR